MITRTWIAIAAALTAAVPGIAAAQANAQASDQRYTCCNLRYEKDWISDHSLTTRSFVPIGAQVVVTDWGRGTVYALIDGVKMRAGVDYGHFKGTREQLAETLFVRDDPKVRLAGFAPAVQAAIRAGRIVLGMTKEQVLMSLGPPRYEITPLPQSAANWVYYASDDGEFDIDFSDSGTAIAINAPSRVRDLVVHRP
ncbi:hypothetical protein [Piscinibacter koreensis]|uniref:Uncharacterized protein n=1 Tax=Piscinibacter koreensis TaxID=2742824 RepID=A0A7Y6NNQ9_9BURK|nr:hypothetical protein [Schlegelella koreensis]NUZ06565.1 hypothetical protein [Schlegelella koreensis]